MTVRDLPVQGKRVLVRVDFNVPMENGQITDDSRIKAALPTIEYLLQHGASIVLMSHLGRPEGKYNPALSLAPCAKRLSELLKQPVTMTKGGRIVLLENLRFHKEEEEGDVAFAKELSSLGSLYVNDAFGTAHRAHASTAVITQFFPGKAAMGLLMEKEINMLTSLLQKPKRPFYAIIGGAKISTKMGVMKKLLELVDGLFIGGAMALPFFQKGGIPELQSPKIHLPVDIVIADAFANNANQKIIDPKHGIPDGWQGMGIGPKTVELWSQEFKKASTIFWNGPLSVFEMPNFAAGTQKIALALSEMKATVVVGGGDSIAAIEQMGLSKKFTHLSTGGGASLEFLEFGHLPGIDALSDKSSVI